MRQEVQRAALLCATAVILIGAILMAIAGHRDFRGRPGEAQTWANSAEGAPAVATWAVIVRTTQRSMC